MLGSDLVQHLSEKHDVASADHRDSDIPVDITKPASIRDVLKSTLPKIVINTAAWTDVDGANQHPDEAYNVNAWGAWNVAKACEEAGIPLCHLSTDFVFDGVKGRPYTEFDPPHPLNVYGASKWAGEQAIHWVTRRCWIVRTQWLYGKGGHNFVHTVARLAREHETLDIVEDQFGAPTWTRDLSSLIDTILHACPFGVYHANNAGETSWADFARAVLEEMGEDPDRVVGITSEQYQSPTNRPARSTLRRLSLEMQGLDNARPWRDALTDFMQSSKADSALL